jgi:hypothetical protein
MRPGAEDEPILAASQSHLKGTEPTKEVTKNQVSDDLRIQEQTIGHQERVVPVTVTKASLTNEPQGRVETTRASTPSPTIPVETRPPRALT